MVTWSKAGDDEALFSIDAASGELSFSAAPNYEEPADADTDNVYHVTVIASSDQDVETKALAVVVTVTDDGPAITGDAAVDVVEGATAVATYTSEAGASWSKAGVDAGAFTLTTDGVLTFVEAPSHGAPTDADADNVYEVSVVAAVGSEPTTLPVSVTVTPKPAPAPAPSSSSTSSSTSKKSAPAKAAPAPAPAAAVLRQHPLRDGQ